MDCPGDFKGRFIAGPTANVKFLTKNHLNEHMPEIFYEKPYKVDSMVDFAMGSCKSTGYYDNFFMKPRFNQTLYDNSIST